MMKKLKKKDIGPLVGFSLVGMAVVYYYFHTDGVKWLLQSLPWLKYWPELQRSLIERSMKPVGEVFWNSTIMNFLGAFLIFVSK